MRLHVIEDIFSIPYDELEERGVDELIVDYDGTLVAKMSELPAIDVVELLLKLSERFHVRIFSNNYFYVDARKKFFAKHGIPYEHTYKPFFSTDVSSRAVVIGDKFLTDGLFALWNNIPCFLLRNRLSFVLKKLF